MTRNGWLWIVFALGHVWGGVLPVQGQDTTSPAPSQPPSATATDRLTDDDLTYWMKALESPQYSVRSAATERLMDITPQQVPRFVAQLREGSLETVQRGTLVLQHLVLMGDAAQQKIARETLESLSQLGPSLVASRAKESLRAVSRELRQRAITQLTAAGAQYLDEGATPFNNARTESLRFGRAWRGDTALLENLRWLPEIQSVRCEGPQVNDTWLLHLAQLPNLTHLRIRKAKITNEGIKAFAKHGSLRYLELYYVPLDNDAVPALSDIRLSRLTMFGNSLTKDQANVLKEATGAEFVDLRPGGAFLGIGSQPQPDESNPKCIVTEVKPNSAAELAGIRVGDEILEYDGTPIDKFDKMIQLIGQQKPGDVCKVKVTRLERTLTFDVPLGEWIEQ